MHPHLHPDLPRDPSALPRMDEEQHAAHPQKQPGQYTVFLVEDDEDDQAQMMNVLRRSPYIYNVHCFESGMALKQHLVEIGYFSNGLLRNIPTLILLDVHMPGSSGMRVLQDLKDHPLTRDIPVIITTGDVSSQTTEEAWRLKANAFAAKPIHLDQIHEVMYTGRGWPHMPQK